MPLFVFILIYAVFALVSAAMKSRQNPKGKPAAAPTRSRKPLAEVPGSAPLAPARKEVPAPAREEYVGSLGKSAREGIDPCHDDSAAVPRGSLRSEIPEGTDPCHDDFAAVPQGSLRSEIPEGTDPCHDSWTPRTPDRPAGPPAEKGGLDLNWTGDDLVKGFVLGEILRRKVS